MVAHDQLDASPGWVYRSDGPAPAPPGAARGWVASGLYLMTLPLAIGMTLMLAPVAWALRSRSRR